MLKITWEELDMPSGTLAPTAANVNSLVEQLHSGSDRWPDAGWQLASIGGPHCSSEMIERLLNASKDPDPEVRAHALKALGKANGERASYRLIEALQYDLVPEIRVICASQIGFLEKSRLQAMPVLRQKLIDDPDWDVRCWCARALAEFGVKAQEALPDLVRAVSDPHPKVRKDATRALGVIASQADAREYIPKLIEKLNDRATRDAAVGALGLFETLAKDSLVILAKLYIEIKTPYGIEWAIEKIASDNEGRSLVIPSLIDTLRNPDEDVRVRGAVLLRRLKATDAIEALLLAAIYDSSDRVKALANLAMGELTYELPQCAIPQIIKLMDNGDPKVRHWAIYLIQGGTDAEMPARELEQAIPTIVQKLRDPDPEVAQAAAVVLTLAFNNSDKVLHALLDYLQSLPYEGIAKGIWHALFSKTSEADRPQIKEAFAMKFPEIFHKDIDYQI